MSQDFFKPEPEAAAEVASQAVAVASRIESRALPQVLGLEVAELPALYEKWLGERGSRFGFWNYVQAPLGYAFTLGYLGHAGAALEWLERTFERQRELSDEARAQLRSRLSAVFRRRC
jgi:hypothetical protein